MSNTLVEMKIGVGNVWANITDAVYTRAPITITRGMANEGSQVSPTTCDLTVDNRSGWASPRNPLGQYYGRIGRNTQLRVAEQVDPVYDAYTQQTGTGNLSWTHTPVGAPTGVCVILWELNTLGSGILDGEVTYGGVPMERRSFTSGTMGAVNLVKHIWWLNRQIPTGPQTVFINTDSVLTRQASVVTFTGGSNCEIDAISATSGSGGNPSSTIQTFKRSIIIEDLLTDLDDGSTITPSTGYTQLSEHDIGTETVAVARSTNVLPAALYGVGWFAAASGWSTMAIAIRAVSYRAWVETSSFPPKSDPSHKDRYVPLSGAGILRRLQQGSDPAETGLRAFTLANSTALATYYPLDGKAGTTYSLNLGKVYPLSTRFAAFPTAANGGPGSNGPSWIYGEPLSPYLGTGMALFHTGNVFSTSYMYGDVGSAGNCAAFDWVWQSTALGQFTVYLNDYQGAQWSVLLNGTPGVAQVSFNDPTTGPIGFSPTGVLPELSDDHVHHGRLQLTKNGTATDWVLYIDGVSVDSGSQAAHNVDGMSRFTFNYQRSATQSWVVLGHLTAWLTNVPADIPTAANAALAAFGYVGEPAGTRIGRIAAIAGISLTAVGTLAATQTMGPQYSESMLTQLRDAESTDMGVLAEPRDTLGLMYRTHASLYNQTPAVTLQYDSGHIAPPFEPIDDDLNTRNDVTASRRDGGSYRATQGTGPLSILPPPNGVGRYPDQVTLNVETDDMLPAVAGWLLHLGTLDEARYPSLVVNLLAPDVIASGLQTALLATDLGDRILIQDANAANIYDDISLIVLGAKEVIGPKEWTLTFNCAPAGLYEVFELDDPGSRLSSGDESTLTSGLTTTATSMSVTSTAGTLWTQAAGDMPIPLMIAGEEMTVTAIAGAASPQTFTVTRSVNGVVKTHAAGEIVRMAHEVVLAL